MKKTSRVGPQNAAILDTEKSLIEKDESRILVLDEDLAKKLKFTREGQFVEKSDAATLRLVGDVVPIDKLEVVKKVKEDLLKDYPFAATQVAKEVVRVLPNVHYHLVWKAFAEKLLENYKKLFLACLSK